VCKNCLIFHLYLILGDPKQWVVYIATDEKDQTFFESFVKTFKTVYFLSDYTESANFTDLNQNHIGMVEQVICANAHTFIGMSLIKLFNLK
jgi:GDP-fucose protein O-fucosyltransferase